MGEFAVKYSRCLACLALLATPVGAQDTVTLPQEKFSGNMELITTFSGPMPTGVTVSNSRRIFINYPRWGDKVDHTVGELKGNKTVPYPPGIKQSAEGGKQEDALVSVQSVVVDPKDRLWILDTGSPLFAPTTFGGPKLVGVDLKTNKIFKKILFPVDVALPTTYLNDIRFDLRRGKDGMAFITDSADKGPNGIIVVDLDTGKSFRRLNDHPSTKAVPDFLPIVEGQPLMQREMGKPPRHMTMGSDGIAISPDGKRLYYCPLAGRHLYSVSIDALVDQNLTEEQLAPNVVDEGDKGGGSDGLETDAQGRIYVTDYEHNGIARRLANGTYETLVYDPRVLWPDTMSIASDGYLYFTNNQLNRQARYHNGKDMRQKPYSLLRVKIDSGPITLSAGSTAQK
jgi:sugar lactone lactonase YvrE